jgi:hypothetical protein
MSDFTCFCGLVFCIEEVDDDEVCLQCGSFLPGAIAAATDRFDFYFKTKHDIDSLKVRSHVG